jgi:hypothetical protein
MKIISLDRKETIFAVSLVATLLVGIGIGFAAGHHRGYRHERGGRDGNHFSQRGFRDNDMPMMAQGRTQTFQGSVRAVPIQSATTLSATDTPQGVLNVTP